MPFDVPSLDEWFSFENTGIDPRIMGWIGDWDVKGFPNFDSDGR